MSFWKPRTIRSQLIAGLIVLEILLLLFFAVVLVREQAAGIRHRAEQRLTYQATLLALQAGPLLTSGEVDLLRQIISTMKQAPTISGAMVTTPDGRNIVSSDPTEEGLYTLTPIERQHLHPISLCETFAIASGSKNIEVRESVAPVLANGKIIAYAWIHPDTGPERDQIRILLRITFLYGIFAIIASVLVAGFLAQTITRPLAVLKEGTRQLIRDPSASHRFPLPVLSSNEASDLTSAFNLMVASMEEQRSGLNDTLALLDSMLANAPTGFAFFDHKFRYVRVNRFLAELNGIPVSRHLGKTPTELFPNNASHQLEKHIHTVFESGHALQDVEVSGEMPDEPGRNRHWLINLYPIRTGDQPVRWVGTIVVDTTERIRSEEALRKTEKLAAAGRLAASIAHEINNPLEAITNLLYLLNEEVTLPPNARRYAEMAQYEVARVSEITQQTLRFYRQSTLPLLSSVSDLIDSVIALHHGRMTALNIAVRRDYRPGGDLFCFTGEMRQLFANLVGNAVDAMPAGGNLCVAVRGSHSWKDSTVKGVRVFVADTGSGMGASVRKHIFEAFFTTKEVTGTGLGLWVSAEIIQKHQGLVLVRSRTAASGKSSGTVFMLFFPEAAIVVTPENPMVEPQP